MLKIQQAKPNPSGKDRLGRYAPPQQLAGEWIDIANIGSTQVSLSDLHVYHKAYRGSDWEWEEVVYLFSRLSSLPVGKIVRVHSGSNIHLSQLMSEDVHGADYHVFTGKNYVWNNNQADKPTIYNSALREFVDQAWYDTNPPEGIILKRRGDKLES